MGLKLSCLIFLGASVIGAECLGQEFRSDESMILDIKVKYYECIDPATPTCVCTREDAKGESCPGCMAWKEEYLSSQKSLHLTAGSYSYSSGPPRANYFVQDFASELYGTETLRGVPPTTAMLYRSPAKYGWFELDKESEKVGSIAVWPGGAGLVVHDDDGDLQILYPSNKLKGALHVEDLTNVTAVKVKYIVPEDFTEMAQEPSPNPPEIR